MSCRVPEALVSRLTAFFERQALGEPSPSTILMKALECYLEAAERYGIDRDNHARLPDVPHATTRPSLEGRKA